MTDSNHPLQLERVPTGIAGLDRILSGGLLKGGLYIVKGTPGAGKTILGNQTCFNHAASGGRVVFVTLLAESHTRMLQHLHTMRFFDQRLIPEKLYYVSGFAALEGEGLKGVVDLLRREIKGHQASLLVLDGFSITEESATSQREFKKFVHDIQNHAAASECTVLLLTTARRETLAPEYTMVDGIFEIEDLLFAQRVQRSLLVRKFRGSAYLRGRHAFQITGKGIELYPRVESAYAIPTCEDIYQPRRMSTGVEGLDRMLGGGLFSETTCGLLGPTGSGKTTFGLQFIGRSTAAEPGLYFGFFETPERLRVRASTIGIDLRALEERGDVEIIWRPQGEHILDDLAHTMIEAVKRRRVKRLFIDGFGGFMESAVYPERMTRFIAALANELRALDATVVMSMETRDIIGATMHLPSDGMSSLLEALIVMRYAEVAGQVRRLLAITKIRESTFDPFLHEFKITSRGIEVGDIFRDVEAVLSGYGRQPRAVPSEATPPAPPTSTEE